MNETEKYLASYIKERYRKLSLDRVPRDHELEEFILLASKLELILQTKITEENLIVFQTTDFKIGSINYSISFIKSSFFRVEKEGEPHAPDLFGVLDLQKISSYDIIFKVPLTSLYALSLGISYRAGIEELRKLSFSETEHSYIDRIKSSLFGRSTIPLNQCFYTYLGDFRCRFIFCYLEKAGKSTKIILPISVCRRCEYFIFPPYDEPVQLFNSDKVTNNAEIIILTDSIEIASENQRFNMGIHEKHVWLALVDNIDLSSFDWSCLKGKQVYYFLCEHSGLGGKTVFNRAKEVDCYLKSLASPIPIKYLCFLPNGIDFDEQSENSADDIKFYESIDEVRQKESNDQRNLTLDNYKQSLEPGTESIIRPFIYNRSSTSIYCDPQSYEAGTLFALNLSYAIIFGSRAFEGWSVKNAGNVKYFINLSRYDDVFGMAKQIGGIFDRRKARNEKYCPSTKFKKIVNPDMYSFDLSSLNRKTERENISDIRNEIFKMENKPPFVVIDLIFSQKEISLQNNLITQLKSWGCTILILSSDENIHKNLLVDNQIKIKSLSTNGIMKMDIRVKSKNSGQKQFKCEFNPNGNPSNFHKVVNRKRKKYSQEEIACFCEQIEQLNSTINEKGKRTYTESQMARTIGVKPGMIKKLRGELDFTNKR